MQWSKIMIVSALLLTGLHATGEKWQKLKSLKMYSGSAYHLNKNVAYMEIRWYKTRTSKEASETLVLYRKPLKDYSEDVVEKFRSLIPKYSNKADIRSYGNAFFIDTEGKMFQMDMKEDIISLLGEIDTRAEVQLVLRLHYEKHGKYCKKTANGYKIKIVEPLTKCTTLKRSCSVDKTGNYIYNSDYTLARKGCRKRKHTRFIDNKKVNYEEYSTIVMDGKGNLYVLGNVKNNKDDDSLYFYVLEKYSSSGKKLWSRKVQSDAESVAVSDNAVYIFNYSKLLTAYTLEGKKRSSGKRSNLSISDKKIEKKTVNIGKYFPEGLPNKKERMDAYISDHLTDKRGNVYIVGSEVFYPSGTPDEVPDGQCGNVEEVKGALIAKLNRKGETVWAKVIDRND